MLFLNDILHQPVFDSQGERVGVLSDLVISGHEAFPVVTGLVVTPVKKRSLPHTPTPGSRAAADRLIIPWKQMASCVESSISTTVPAADLTQYTPRPGDVFLARDLLDKQIVDTDGRRVVRVNDLKLTQVRGGLRLLGADISGQAFLRRLLPFRFSEQLVPWNYVAPITATPGQVKLTVSQTRLSSLHPADLADLIEQMHPEAAADALEHLDVEVAADALEEIQDVFKANILEEMETRVAADVLEAMPADEAADIVGDLTEERAREILAEMQPEEAAEVKELLQYDDDSAGGRMTSEILTLPAEMTAAQAIDHLRTLAPDAETPYYLFVVDKEEHLLGNVSLRNLVTAGAGTRLDQLTDSRMIKVEVDTDQEEVARVIHKYNLLAVPVVDHENRLQGMVTLNDIVDVIREETTEDAAHLAGTTVEDVERTAPPWQAALGRVIRLMGAVAGGVVAALILRAYSPSLQQVLPLAYFIPMLLSVAGGFVAQSLVASGGSAARRGGSGWATVGREAGLGLLVGIVAGGLVMALASVLTGSTGLGIVLGASLATALPIAGVIGAAMPMALERFGADATWASGPLLDPLVSVISILIYCSLATFLIQQLI